MKKQFYTLTVTLMIVFFPFLSKAQSAYEDVVYLKNGSIIHGLIIEQIPNQSIKIQTRDGNVFFYKIEEIEKLTKEQIKSVDNNLDGNKIKQSGYTLIIELNLAEGLGSSRNDHSYGMEIVNGYLINPYFSIGIGVGVAKHKYSTFLPIYTDIRINFINKEVTPFFIGDFGYGIEVTDRNNGGLFANPSFGVKFFIAPRTALNLSLGYRLQESNYDYGYSSYKFTDHYLNFKIGAAF
jgi:hypothetical protein